MSPLHAILPPPHSKYGKLSEMSKASWHFRIAHRSLPHTISSILHLPTEPNLPPQCSAWAHLPSCSVLCVPWAWSAALESRGTWAGELPTYNRAFQHGYVASFRFAVLGQHPQSQGSVDTGGTIRCHLPKRSLGSSHPTGGTGSPEEAQAPTATVVSSSFIC